MKKKSKIAKKKIKPVKAKVKPIPDGYHTLTSYLIADNAAKALDFYKKAFGAKELFRMAGPDGKIAHSELKIGDSKIMVGDESPQMGALGPKSIGGSPVTLMLYVKDVDKLFTQAVAAGAKETRPVMNQFYGDRSGSLEDPFGHKWVISTRVENVSPKEMDKRMKAMMAEMPA